MNESALEEAVMSWFAKLDYDTCHGPELAPGEPRAERDGYGDVLLLGRLREALKKLNSKIPAEALEDAVRKVTRSESPSLIVNNRQFYKFLVEGVPVEYHGKDGQTVHDDVRLIDFENPDKNDWLAVNQFTVVEGKRNRRADVVIFINGLPLAVFELKNPADENATLRGAFNQFQTYKADIPCLFPYNAVLVISDGIYACAGTLTSEIERFSPWRTIDGDLIAPKGVPELEVLVKGIFAKQRFLDLLRNFIVFEDDGEKIEKKMAAYHQYHAVNKAVDCTVAASAPRGDKRAGVVWHTQGSGKSLSMVFFAGKIIQHPKMANPTLLVLTDRNDLDGQLFGTFCACQTALRQKPVQADSREHLRQLLKRASGGVIFTTIQKFMPEEKGEKYPLLSERRNILVIADEAHRSQYDFVDGYARHLRDALPGASFIGFTGTPIEKADANTRAVFGDYVDIYDIQRAVEDKATVPIYYEGRLAKLELKEKERPKIDPEFEEVTEGEEQESKERLKSRWARLEAMVGTEKRIGRVAQDLVEHFEKRLSVMDGKGMIVCMSRRICVDLYNAIIKLRPQWHETDDKRGFLKVVMTGSAADPQSYQPHIRNKAARQDLANRFRAAKDPFKLVIVRDMWLTGFDAPCLHTMYIDKPMRGHGLMQAIARVNRVFGDKPGGLVVDYIGIADQLRQALATYTEEGGKGQTAIDQEQAVAVMREKYEIVSAMFHGFDYKRYFASAPAARLGFLASGMEYILRNADPKKRDEDKGRYLKGVRDLSSAFALAVPHEAALKVQDEIGFFQAVRASLAKTTGDGERRHEDIDAAIRQIVSQAVSSNEVVDIFSAAGLKKPNLGILSEEFLAEIRGMPHRNLALEVLKKLLNDEIKVRAQKNLVQSRSFAEMLERTIRTYQNRALETAQVIDKLIQLAKDMRGAYKRGEDLKLTEEELAFYDALEVNDSAVKVLGDETLRAIARELVETVHRNVSIDWTVKESVRAKLRTMVKRLLRKHGYPPDKREKATQTVLEQAALLCKDVAA
jgi:type I restriction enzyme R subunit